MPGPEEAELKRVYGVLEELVKGMSARVQSFSHRWRESLQGTTGEGDQGEGHNVDFRLQPSTLDDYTRLIKRFLCYTLRSRAEYGERARAPDGGATRVPRSNMGASNAAFRLALHV